MQPNHKVLPENSKVWIFPSSRKFYLDETKSIQEKMDCFLKEWEQDKQTIISESLIKYDRFIIVFASSKMTISTDSINKLIHFIKNLEKEHQTTLLDKMNVCFKQGYYVQYKELKEFKKLIKTRAVSKNTVVFDNLVTNKKEFETIWEVPACESWYGNLFK